MAQIETWYNQDLQQPVKVHYLDGSLFSHNSNGNRIGVHVFSNGEPVTLSGTVSGYVVTADGSTVPCTGTRSGNSASILIPAAAYQPGAVFITLFITDGTTVTTLASVSTSVLTARTNNQIDPGSVVTDWTQTVNAAMQSVETAAENLGGIIAVPYANITYPVPLGKYTYYEGNLYRCISPIATSESFTAAHWTQVRLGDDVSDLKSALTYTPANVFSDRLVLGRSISADGSISNTPTSSLTDYIAVNTGETFLFPNITDGNNITLNFHVARYTTNSASGFYDRQLGNNAYVSISDNIKYVRIMFSRPSASGVTMTQTDIDTYFNGKIYNLGYETYANIQSLLPLKDRQIWFDVGEMGLEWTLGRSVSSEGEITNTPTSALTGYLEVYQNELYDIKNVVDANNITISVYIVFYSDIGVFESREKAENCIIPEGIKYIRIMFTRPSASGVTMTQEDIDTYFDGQVYQIGQRLQSGGNGIISNEFFEEYNETLTWALSRTVQANGIEIGATTYALCDYVERTTEVGFKTRSITDNNGNAFYTYVVCYDKYKRYLGRFSGEVVFTPDVVFYRFVFGRLSSTGIAPSQNTIKTYFAIDIILPLYIICGKAPSWDKPKNVGVLNCLLRAKQLVDIIYTTTAVLPNQIADVPANTKVIGAPYSSARYYDKFIGLNVSIHSFMTSIANPRSVIYTESLSTDNAKTYYGTVCSSFTAYALQSPVREVTKKILENVTDYTTRNINDIQIGDICVNDGHIILISGIERDFYGRILNVVTMESLPPHCVRTSYTWDAFVNEVAVKQYRIATYHKLIEINYTASKYVPLMDEEPQVIQQPKICVNWGDGALIRKGESATINVLGSSGATGVVLEKDNVVIGSYSASDVTITNLDSGHYVAKLINGQTTIAQTTWDVCYAEITKSGNRVSFGSFENCSPQYISFNDRTGSAFFCIELTSEDIENGYVDTDYEGQGVDWLKIYVGNTDSSTSFGVYI